LRQNASILKQGCAGFSPGSANRCDQFTRNPGRTSPSLRSGLSFRYTQHGWPLSSDAFEDQMFCLVSHGYRCIAHDRRGHGRSSQPWTGNDMNTYADDLAELVQKLDLKNATHVGHSTGGGEVARYIARHGTKRVAKAVLIASVPPIMLKTSANPGGLPITVFDGLRASVIADRAQFWRT
jgi:non-heme chloroperoxidase